MWSGSRGSHGMRAARGELPAVQAPAKTHDLRGAAPRGASMPRLRPLQSHLRASALAALGALSTLAAAGAAFTAAGDAADKFAKEVLAEGLLFTYGVAFVKGLGA